MVPHGAARDARRPIRSRKRHHERRGLAHHRGRCPDQDRRARRSPRGARHGARQARSRRTARRARVDWRQEAGRPRRDAARRFVRQVPTRRPSPTSRRREHRRALLRREFRQEPTARDRSEATCADARRHPLHDPIGFRRNDRPLSAEGDGAVGGGQADPTRGRLCAPRSMGARHARRCGDRDHPATAGRGQRTTPSSRLRSKARASTSSRRNGMSR